MDVHTDPLLDQQTHGHIMRVFLTAYWARNLTAHHYTLEDDLYSDLYDRVYRAIYYAMLYTWEYAMQKGWVTGRQRPRDGRAGARVDGGGD